MSPIGPNSDISVHAGVTQSGAKVNWTGARYPHNLSIRPVHQMDK
jgi:hypothetical protein